jgi:putative DNA primase/helicase
VEQGVDTVLEAALRYVDGGLKVIPIKGDGSKSPALATWKPYQTRLPRADELHEWFDGKTDVGIAVLGGDGVEVLDFDRPVLFEQFHELVTEQAPGLVDRLPQVQTPRGGRHLYYRCESIAPSTKLAKDKAGKTLIETKGEGGYVLAPPSPPSCHPEKKPYVHMAGPDLPDIPFISPDQRQLLHETARSFNCFAKKVVTGPQPARGGGVRPGDAFNDTATWDEVLEPAGWSVARRSGDVVYWRRPDATGPGHSATTGYCGDRLYCFTTNGQPFEADTCYTKFTAYAFLYHGGDFKAASRELAGEGYGQAPAAPDADDGGIHVHVDGPNEAPDDPHRLARLFVEQRCQHADGLTLRFWRAEWHRWDGQAYRPVPEGEVKAEVCDFIKSEFNCVNLEELHAYGLRAKERQLHRGEEPPTVRKVTQGLVGNVMQALTGLTVLPTRTEQPAWVEGVAPFPAGEILAASNGLVHLASLVEGKDFFRQPTPRFFSPNVLDYAFDADAQEPKAWLEFLNKLWPDDLQSVETLQEWFGYCLLPDTRQQKMLLLVGPKRSGKGTVARVLSALVGPGNVAGPTLSGLATSFGLWPLIGKTLAVISDARLSGRTDATVITERLLSISGEDALTVDRKHLPPVTLKLAARFVVLTNELPKVNDTSGALAGRMLLLRLTRSWYCEEDTTLTQRLLGELPGILRWAVAGWQRLRDRRHFVQPESGKELRGQLEDLGSPVGAFLRECCVVGAEYQVTKDALYDRWTQWCATGGQQHPGDKATFGRNLLAALPTVRSAQQRNGDRRVACYLGMGLAKP